ncbi:hypothetical protein [Absidia glauca]|uniref:Nudix hydrolase domain-containing protein n=1 Tax=Absidia glauca TaxID=4829 RepID=A0A163KPD7_ABSGL|nr:hypothetical protein [Absidia glauca]
MENQQPTIEYTNKARHGHGNDMVDDNNVRQVAGCLPIDPVKQKVLLITSSNKNNDNWVLPKGGWEDNESQVHAALRETWEEAGIKGKITKTLGIFEEANKRKVKAHHWIFEMEIQEVCKKFPEKKKRERRWYTYDEALIVVKGQYLKDALMLSSLNPANRLPSHPFPPVTTLVDPPSVTLPPAVASPPSPKDSSPPSPKQASQKQAGPPSPKQASQKQAIPPSPTPSPPKQSHHFGVHALKSIFKKS